MKRLAPFVSKACLVDLSDKVSRIMIQQLAKQQKVEQQVIHEKIKTCQGYYRTNLMKSLVKEHPILSDFLNLMKQREKAIGYNAEKMDSKR